MCVYNACSLKTLAVGPDLYVVVTSTQCREVSVLCCTPIQRLKALACFSSASQMSVIALP